MSHLPNTNCFKLRMLLLLIIRPTRKEAIKICFIKRQYVSFFLSKDTICVFDSKLKQANCLNKSIAVTVSFKLLLFSGLTTIWLKLEFKQVYKDHCFRTMLVSNYVAAKVFHWFSLLSLEFESPFLQIKVVQDKYAPVTRIRISVPID